MTDDPGPGVRVHRDGPVAVLTIDRPGVRNALDPPALRALADTVGSATGQGVRALVLTGSGAVSFCAGMDLRALATGPPAAVAEAVAAFDAAFDDPARPALVAAVNGAATGGGFELALRCDLLVAAEHAIFRLPEVQRGIVPGGRATLLPSRIPLAVALEIALLGEPVPAARALQLGLVNRVVAGPDVLATAVDLGRRLARAGPLALARTRDLMWTAAIDGAAAAWSRTLAGRDDPDLAAEMHEGVAAFLEKRPPAWDGPQACADT